VALTEKLRAAIFSFWIIDDPLEQRLSYCKARRLQVHPGGTANLALSKLGNLLDDRQAYKHHINRGRKWKTRAAVNATLQCDPS
jgi:hypothetical protein